MGERDLRVTEYVKNNPAPSRERWRQLTDALIQELLSEYQELIAIAHDENRRMPDSTLTKCIADLTERTRWADAELARRAAIESDRLQRKNYWVAVAAAGLAALAAVLALLAWLVPRNARW